MYLPEAPTRLDQGVIVSGVYHYSLDDKGLGLIVTPTCDFAQDKADFVQVCPLSSATEFIKALLLGDQMKAADLDDQGDFKPWENWSNGRKGNFKNLVGNLSRQKLPRFHWLSAPPEQTLPLVADFQQITSHVVEEISGGHIGLMARLASPFREEVAARYAAYMGRIGTPDPVPGAEDELVGLLVGELFG